MTAWHLLGIELISLRGLAAFLKRCPPHFLLSAELKILIQVKRPCGLCIYRVSSPYHYFNYGYFAFVDCVYS